MKQLGMKVPEEDHDAVERYEEENGCTKSEAGRVMVSRGLEYPKLEAENESLQEDLQSLKSENEELRKQIYDLNEERSRFIEDIILTTLENIGDRKNRHPPRPQG